MYNQKIIKKIKRCAKEGSYDEYEGAFTDIDGIVAAIMPLDRCIRHEGESGSVYDERGSLVF